MSQDRDRYFNAIETTLGSRFSLDYDATPWLEYFTGIQVEQCHTLGIG